MANTLSHSPADIIRWALIGLSLGSDPSQATAWPIYQDKEPSSPDNCMTLYDTEGHDDGRTMTEGEIQTHYGFQVRIRATSATVGWVKADAVRKAMAESIRNTQVSVGANTYNVQVISHIGNVLRLGDESPTSNRKLLTINAATVITQLA